MEQPNRYIIRFDGMERPNAGQAAESLRRSLQEVDPAIQAKRIRTDSEALDFGSALAVVLAAPAVVTLAKGISNWLARSRTSKLTVIGPDGAIIAENIGAKDAITLVEKLEAHAKRQN
jgi:hypothetical protein